MMNKYFNPYKNSKCLEWALDNDDDFRNGVEAQSVIDIAEGLNIKDYLAHRGGAVMLKALKYFDNFDFQLDDKDITFGYCAPSEKIGGYITGRGWMVGEVPLREEIELQADNGEFYYHYIGLATIPLYATPWADGYQR